MEGNCCLRLFSVGVTSLEYCVTLRDAFSREKERQWKFMLPPKIRMSSGCNDVGLILGSFLSKGSSPTDLPLELRCAAMAGFFNAVPARTDLLLSEIKIELD